jgi:hypothetical protein
VITRLVDEVTQSIKGVASATSAARGAAATLLAKANELDHLLPAANA